MRSASILALLMLAGCADKTALIVEVRSDLRVGAGQDINGLSFSARSANGQMAERTFTLETQPALRTTWPQDFSFLPGRDRSSPVTITVVGRLDGVDVVRAVATSSFVAGRSERVIVNLTRSCLTVSLTCPDGTNCQDGMCMSVQLDAGVPDAGRDAQIITMDTGVDDAGEDGSIVVMEDAGTDGGMMPMDAGTDGGMITPMDAGSDGGMMPMDSGMITRCTGPSCVGLVVVSEFSTRGPGGGAGDALDEFVEIYNRSGAMLDVSGLELYYLSASGVASRRATVGSGVVLRAGGYLLFGSTNFTGGTPDVGDRWASGFSDTGGAVEIRAGAGGTVIDRIAWGSATVSEGTPVGVISTAMLTAGASYERKALTTSTTATMAPGGTDELAGNGYDMNDNSMDVVPRTLRQAQTATGATEPP